MLNFRKLSFNTNTTNITSQHAVIKVSNLEAGFGITLGNSLRRTMLLSTPGVALFAVKITDVNHEYQAIKGIEEDAMQLISNLKNLVIKINNSVYSAEDLESAKIESWPVMTLALRNPGEVTAKDIKLPQGFEIVNKDLYICTVSTSVKIDVDLYATIGHGFRSFTVNAKNIDSLSLIAVDSNFSPIVNFSYKVEEEKNDLNSISDSLILDITTNGSVTPVDALVMASKIMTSHFEELSNVSDKIQEIRVFEQKEEIKKQKHLVTTIDDLNLSFRSVNSLKKAAIYTLSDLTNLTRNDLNNVNNLGKKSIKEITNKLKELKLQLKHESES